MASLISPSAAFPGTSSPLSGPSQANGHLPAGAAPSHASSSSSTAAPQSAGHVQLDSIDDAITALANGEFVVVMDDLSRENEGDLVIAASLITTERMAFMIRHTSGFICVGMLAERLDQLSIPPMVAKNTDKHKTAYTVTVDVLAGTTTGISAHDRALTARKLADPSSRPDDFSRPGHMMPLRAVEGGVLARRGHTEAATDLCRLAGLPAAGVLCELVKPDDPMGNMARRDDCYAFAKQHGLRLITIEALEVYRRQHNM